MGVLKDLGLVIGDDKKASQLFEKLFPDFMKIKYEKPSDYIKYCWGEFLKESKGNKSLNGKLFEYVLATLFIRENFLPLYISAKVAFVPNVIYDLMLYTAERGPICISMKTSLRERYKQADLEAIALKYVHRKALAYLLTLEAREAKSVKGKIKSGDVIGLDDVIVASAAEFDTLIDDLRKFVLTDPPTVKVIQSTQVITKEKVKAITKK